MLSKSQLVELFDRLGTPPEGRELVMRIRSSPPAREVQSTGSNVLTEWVSRKMGREYVATESWHVEFPSAVDKEFNDLVFEFYPQPKVPLIELVDPASGEVRRSNHIPDFLVIAEDGFTLEEWKSEAKLRRLAEEQPYRYERSGDGRWFSSQLESQFAKIGFRYRICSELSLPRQRIDNYLLLEDYLKPGADLCPQEELDRLANCLKEEGALHLETLYSEPLNFKSDHVLKAIADRLVVVDMDGELLSQPRRSCVYRDSTFRDFVKAHRPYQPLPGMERMSYEIAAGAECVYDGQEMTITLVGETQVICRTKDDHTLSFERGWLVDAAEAGKLTIRSTTATDPAHGLADLSEREMAQALMRHQILKGRSGKASARSKRRWNHTMKLAAASGVSEVAALVSRARDRGNRNCKLDDDQLGMIDEIYKTEWLTKKAKNAMACYRDLKVLCNERGVKAPSYPTFLQHIKQRTTNSDVRIRHGKRIAYQQSEFVNVLHYNTPVHGSRPFQYVHIDHTQLDIELICSRTGKNLGRPWLTVAIDAWSRRILAFYLTYDSPSYTSVMMVVRDMVRRHNRLPQFLIVDNGSDLRSRAFKNFMKAMGVHLRYRPAGKPRVGSVMERIFGTMHTQYVHNLAGNTKATKNVRMVTGKHLPARLAEWTLELLYYGIQFWAMDYYNEVTHSTLGVSPMEAWKRGERDFGSRPMRRVALTRDFLISTCPPVDREGVRKVNPQRGVKFDHRLYWNPDFSKVNVAGTSVEVRFDPWDASSVYARVKNQWVRARCRALIDLEQMTEEERKAVTAEFGRRGGDSKDIEADKQRLREFIQIMTPKGVMALELARQAENKALYNRLEISSIEPSTSWDKFPQIHIHKSSSAPKSEMPRPAAPTPAPGPEILDNLPHFESF